MSCCLGTITDTETLKTLLLQFVSHLILESFQCATRTPPNWSNFLQTARCLPESITLQQSLFANDLNCYSRHIRTHIPAPCHLYDPSYLIRQPVQVFSVPASYLARTIHFVCVSSLLLFFPFRPWVIQLFYCSRNGPRNLISSFAHKLFIS